MESSDPNAEPELNPNDPPRPLKEGEDFQQEKEEEEEHGEEDEEPQHPPLPSRTPFTNLSQVDRDLALARTLQEQERAYMMLRMGGEYGASDSGSEYVVEDEEGEEGVGNHGSLDGSEYNEDEDMDAFDTHEIDPAEYEDDEAFARALQEAEEREVAVRLMALAGINDRVEEGMDDHGSNSQETWEDVDPDDFSYEELIALGEAVGTESRGLSHAEIALLPKVSYKAQIGHEHPDQCAICRLDYEEDNCLIVLPCKHTYHSECINKWLHINKVCPICSVEVATS